MEENGKTQMRMFRHIASDTSSGQDVNYVLRAEMGLSHACVRRAKLIEGALTLDGKPCWTVARVQPGQEVAIAIDDADLRVPESSVAPEDDRDGLLRIVYEDEDLLVVDKPAGMSMYPGPGHDSGTLGNLVRGYLQCGGRRCGLHPVQRLDKGTSGLVLFATSAFAKDQLQRQLHTPCFQRTYLAVCEGCISADQGVIDVPWVQISSHPNTFGALGTDDGTDFVSGPKRAITRYRVLARNEAMSLVCLQLETGRTHQIRIHMAHIGHPLVGDATYGATVGNLTDKVSTRESLNGAARELSDKTGGDAPVYEPFGGVTACGVDSKILSNSMRPALHSWRVRVEHPVTKERMEFAADVPDDMLGLFSSSWRGSIDA